MCSRRLVCHRCRDAQAPGLGTASLNGLLIRGLYQVLPEDLPLYEQVRVCALVAPDGPDWLTAGRTHGSTHVTEQI